MLKQWVVIFAVSSAGLLGAPDTVAGKPGTEVTPPSRTGLSCLGGSVPAHINELNDINSGAYFDYIEIKVLQGQTDIDGWKLCSAQDGNASSVACALLGAGTGYWLDGSRSKADNHSQHGTSVFDANSWITYGESDNKGLAANTTKGEVILVDADGSVLDYIAYSRNGRCTSQNYWTVDTSACGVCLDLSNSSSSKVLARGPDGTGSWGDVATPTVGATNDPVAVADGIDHYHSSHDGVAVTCQPESITITAHSAAHEAVVAAGASLGLATTSGKGQWAGVIGGTGSLSANNDADGGALYQFPAEGEASVTLQLSYTNLSSDPELFSIDVDDGEHTDLRSSASGEDPDLSVAKAGLLFSGVPTQIAGKNSDVGWNATLIQLQAVKAADGDPSVCTALFGGSLAVELGAECRLPNSCNAALTVAEDDGDLATATAALDAIETRADNGAAQTSAYSPVTLTFGSTAPATTALALNYPDAGLVQLHARYQLLDGNGLPSGDYIYGSSNDFVVRPFALGFSAIDGGGSPGVVNPQGEAPDGSGFLPAATVFEFDLGGYRYAAGEDGDGDGVADAGVDVTDNGLTPNFTATVALALGTVTPAASNGVLSAAPVSITSHGIAIDQRASYNEVGSLRMVAQVEDYGGAADADVAGVSPVVGRFYPQQLVLLAGAEVTGRCNNMTYMDQPGISVDFTLEAQNAAGERTRHYDAALLGAANLASVAIYARNGDDGVDRGARLDGLNGAWVAGRYPVSSGSVRFARAATADGPFDQLQLGVGALDPLPEALSLLGASGAPASLALGSPTLVRYGRLAAENAYGPETEPLPQPLQAQYYDSTSGRFVRNGLDDCSEVAALTLNGLAFDPGQAVDLGNGASSLPSVAEADSGGFGFKLQAGDAGLFFSAPGAGRTGSVNLGVDLGAYPWLQYDWNGDGAPDAAMRPALSTFGRYRGNDRVLLWK